MYTVFSPWFLLLIVALILIGFSSNIFQADEVFLEMFECEYHQVLVGFCYYASKLCRSSLIFASFFLTSFIVLQPRLKHVNITQWLRGLFVDLMTGSSWGTPRTFTDSEKSPRYAGMMTFGHIERERPAINVVGA